LISGIGRILPNNVFATPVCGLGKNLVQVLLHAPVACEIGIDEFRGLFLLDA